MDALFGSGDTLSGSSVLSLLSRLLEDQAKPINMLYYDWGKHPAGPVKIQ